MHTASSSACAGATSRGQGEKGAAAHDGTESAPSPMPLVAPTRTVYCAPLISPCSAVMRMGEALRERVDCATLSPLALNLRGVACGV